MKLQLPINISNSSDLSELIRFASVSISKIQTIINGNVDLVDNASTQLLTFVFTKSNSDVGVSHSLGRVPQGYIMAGSTNNSLTIGNGQAETTDTNIYLQANAAGTVKVLVF